MYANISTNCFFREFINWDRKGAFKRSMFLINVMLCLVEYTDDIVLDVREIWHNCFISAHGRFDTLTK